MMLVVILLIHDLDMFYTSNFTVIDWMLLENINILRLISERSEPDGQYLN